MMHAGYYAGYYYNSLHAGYYALVMMMMMMIIIIIMMMIYSVVYPKNRYAMRTCVYRNECRIGN